MNDQPMGRCPRCGQTVPADAGDERGLVVSRAGDALPKSCPACGTELEVRPRLTRVQALFIASGIVFLLVAPPFLLPLHSPRWLRAICYVAALALIALGGRMLNSKRFVSRR